MFVFVIAYHWCFRIGWLFSFSYVHINILSCLSGLHCYTPVWLFLLSDDGFACFLMMLLTGLAILTMIPGNVLTKPLFTCILIAVNIQQCGFKVIPRTKCLLDLKAEQIYSDKKNICIKYKNKCCKI